MVSLQVPNDAYRPHVVRAAEIQDLLDDLIRSLVGMVVVAAAPPTLEPLVARVSVPFSPEGEG